MAAAQAQANGERGDSDGFRGAPQGTTDLANLTGRDGGIALTARK